MNNFSIIISSRLRKNPVARLLADLDTNIRFLSLRRGEFVLSSNIGIWYQTADEFTEALKSRRVYREVLELKREFINPIIIIEGGDPLADPTLDITVRHAAHIFISAINRIPILTTANEIETAQLLFMLSGQIESPVSADDLSAAYSAETAEGTDNQEMIVRLLPDVGPALARSMLLHFRTLSRLFTATLEELNEIEGVGPKKAKKIFDFMRAGYANRHKQAG